jgi:hypothetical protein
MSLRIFITLLNDELGRNNERPQKSTRKQNPEIVGCPRLFYIKMEASFTACLRLANRHQAMPPKGLKMARNLP